MSLFDECLTDTHIIAGAAAAGGHMAVQWIPAAGEVWEVDSVQCWHDDVAAPAMTYHVASPLGDTVFGVPNAPAAGVRRSMYQNDFPGKIYVSPQNTIQWECAVGATNGAVATMEIVGRVIRGAR